MILKTKKSIYQKKLIIIKGFNDFIDVIRIRKIIEKEKSNQVIDTIIKFISQYQIPSAGIETIRNLNQQITILLKMRDHLQNLNQDNIKKIIELREELQKLIEKES